MDQLLGFALDALGHFIQDVGCLMHPATLLGDWAIFFRIRLTNPIWSATPDFAQVGG